jgi:ribosomal protein S18 acetylase RimI-like enzyme
MGVRYEFAGTIPPAKMIPDISLEIRRPTKADQPLLTGLYLVSFKDTIDDHPLMSREITNFFNGKYGPPKLDLSRIVFDKNELIAACLITIWNECPSITFLMVRPSFRRRGLASHLLGETLVDLDCPVCTYITPGNRPSESFFGKFGFYRSLTGDD